MIHRVAFVQYMRRMRPPKKRNSNNVRILLSKITFPDTLTGFVAGPAVRIHVPSARPATVACAPGQARQFEAATKPA